MIWFVLFFFKKKKKELCDQQRGICELLDSIHSLGQNRRWTESYSNLRSPVSLSRKYWYIYTCISIYDLTNIIAGSSFLRLEKKHLIVGNVCQKVIYLRISGLHYSILCLKDLRLYLFREYMLYYGYVSYFDWFWCILNFKVVKYGALGQRGLWSTKNAVLSRLIWD
jgi:hypothetical protein